MDARNKVMLVAAIGAILVLISSTAVRCTLAHITQDEAASPSNAQEEREEQGSNENTAPEAEDEDSETPERDQASAKDSALELLRSHAWQAEGDAEITVSFRDGAFIESDSDGVAITAFELVSESADDSHAVLEIKLSRDGESEKQSSVIVVEGREGSLRVSCDGFSKATAYVQGAQSGEPVATSGVSEPYTTLIEGKTDLLAASIAQWCRDNAPTATQASFDGEVFVDVNNARVVATFTCDDAARTILSVEYAGGQFTVSG